MEYVSEPRRRKDGGVWGSAIESPGRAKQTLRKEQSREEFLSNYWRHKFKAPPVNDPELIRVTNLCQVRGPHGFPCFGVYDDARHF